MRLTVADIEKRLGIAPSGATGEITDLLTDSRSLAESDGVLFFAIRTARNDGHRYLRGLYQQGVRYFVVDHIPADMQSCKDAHFFIVPDSVRALQQICRRSPEFKGTLVGITGSRGKTTVKEWLYQLLEPLSEVVRSPRSFNSQIGVPLSMWGLDSNASVAIIEAGVSRCHEMANLADCIDPDVVIITNVGDAHAEGFSSREEKAMEKAHLASAPNVKRVIIPADDEVVVSAVEKNIKPGVEILTWSFTNPGATLYIKEVTPEAGGVRFTYVYNGSDTYNGSDYELTTPVKADSVYDHENVATSLLLMLSMGVSPEKCAELFSQLHKIGTRLNVSEGVNGCSVIRDQYTSDFSSLAPALDFMRRRAMPDQSLTVILSDIHHEASDPAKRYKDIADLLEKAGVSRFIGVGPMLKKYQHLFNMAAQFFDTSDQLLQSLSPSDFSDEIILVKGGPEYDFADVVRMLEARTHETVLEVNLDSIVSNYNYFRSKVPQTTGMICMVKASGYGAGSYEIAKTLQDCGAAYVAVAVLDEGIELRNNGITMPVMVMNPRVANYAAMFNYALEPEIYSLSMLEDVIREARKAGVKHYPIHIKLDTGMHRMGFVSAELEHLCTILKETDCVEVRSIFSHLATADCLDMDDYTQMQLDTFTRWSEFIMSRLPYKIKRHILNTAGILRFPQYHFDMVRLGIGLYGANTLPPEYEKPLAVVSTLRTVIIAIHEWEAGETVGYSRRGVLNRKSRIATIPVGYADGINRHFGNGAVKFMVNGCEAPTIGNICMDICMLDVTDIECAVGDSVEIFGSQAPVQRLADVLDTIPYEILTSVSERVKRVYYRE